ncbi:DUF742 domain-containing protein [Dactylosporangium sucinum]|uniref:DUF742 domain-containing protein n=1 Tax=Dactylosporangium sucinum TaxID=1424081 RepID=A0A917THS7_9ACTN|nr:DUF742 domain-containing protein [Dactylosporangium sucinum]GGM23698.1 hypothetical protein GCM10007977_026080 [Dactylosporangium sucinum]
MTAPEDPVETWVDDHAGPVVRPYAMTRGRTQPVRGTFDRIALVRAMVTTTAPEVGLEPEHLSIIRLCQQPTSVSELAAYLDLPLGTIRVMLGDLLDRFLVQVSEPAGTGPDIELIEAAINGLRAL